MHLLQLTEGTREHQSSNGVSVSIRTVRVQLASRVSRGDVELGQIADAIDLYVVGCLDKVRASDSAVRDQAGPIAVLDTPRNFDAFGVTYRRV